MPNIKIMCVLPAGCSKVGGMENVLINLINAFPTNPYRFAICCLSKDQGIAKEIVRKDIEVFEFEKKHGVDYYLIPQLARLFRIHNIQIVHTRNWGALLYGVIAAKLAGVPILVHGEHGRGRPENTVWRRAITRRILCHWVDRIVVVCQDLKRTLISEGIESHKIVVIPNGVDIDRFNSALNPSKAKFKIGVNPGEKVIGTVGRLEPIKDHKTLLYAGAQIIRHLPNVKFLFVGDGSLRSYLETLAGKLGLQRNTIFLGHRDDIVELMNIMDIFVLPSLNEGMSNTILEAMACGKPVVATNVGGNCELVINGVTGLLVPPFAAAQMATAIHRLITDSHEAQQMGQNARQRVENHFSFSKMLKQYDNLYKSLLKNKGLISDAQN